jgi:hypothetical protein
MRKIASKKLFLYLQETGALASGDEAIITEAKRAYRRQYKREHRLKQKGLPKKELRPSFTERQYHDLILKAKRNGYKPTVYIKELVIATLNGQPNLLPFRERLTSVLQNIMLANNSIHSIKAGAFVITIDQLNEIEILIKEAEERLTEYLYLR